MLFYAGVVAGVHFEAQRLALPPLPASEVPPWRDTVRVSRLVPLLAPLALLLALLYRGSSITKAGFYAILALVALFLLADLSAAGMKARLLQIGRALADGGRAAATIAPILIAVGVFTHLLGLTGVAPKISGLIVQVGAHNLVGALCIAALVPFVLGTALPTAATYILSVALIAPPVLRLGLDVVAVHMFLIYWATLAAVTPPTCTGCIVAANISGGNWLRTALVGMRLGVVAFLVPFFFVLDPALVGRAGWAPILLHSTTALLGAVTMAAGLFGFFRVRLRLLQRIAATGVGALLLYPDVRLLAVGLVAGGALLATDHFVRLVSRRSS